MNLFKRFAAGCAVCFIAISAMAQAGFDAFGPWTVIYTPIKNITATDSNSVIDIHGYVGVANLFLYCNTNAGGGAQTLNIYQSPDRTNWVALANYANAVSSSVKITNNYYGTNLLIATNNYFLSGTLTTPTASSSGFATPYLSPAAFTNNGTLTVSSNVLSIGFVASDAGRYLQFDWVVTGGTNPTNTVGAIFVGRKQQYP